MEASVRAVEAYRRSRMVDSVTTEDDKIAAVYRLEEVCSTLRSAPSDVVKEMVLYIMKRLEHKSPVVKQKVLRLIKFAAAAPKGGVDFKREMQRQGGTVRQLVHYRGQMDALKGDSLNKAVRETAQEALTALFAEDRQGVVQEEAGVAGRRIQGFGNTPVDRPFDDTPKTILGGMIGFGSASLMKGINMVTGGQGGDVPSGYMSSSGGSHRGPTTGLRRSLTAERERDRDRDKYDKYDPKEVAGGPESEDPRASTSERAAKVSGGREGSTERRASTQEERLLDTITAAGGVRLHPTRDALQAFLTDAAKLDALNLCNALEKKLQAHSWQVRLKAMCVLEALLRQREVKTFGKVAELFEDDGSIVNECLKSPQMSLREKTKKVLDLLGVSQDGSGSEDGRGVNLKLPPPPPPPGGGGGVAAALPAPVVAAALPDLLDTDDWDFSGNADATKDESAVRDELQQKQADVAEQSDILGSSDWSATFQGDADLEGSDPFAGMAVHPLKDAGPEPAVPDLFAGMEAADGRISVNGAASGLESKDDDGLFAGVSLNSTESAAGRPEAVDGLANLMAGLATNGAQNGRSPLDQFHTNQPKQQSQPSLSGTSGGFPSNLPDVSVLPHTNMPVPNYAAGAVLQQQLMLMNMYSRGIPRPFAPGPNPMLQQGFMPGFVPLGGMNAAFPPQQVTGGLSGLSAAGNVGGLVNSHGPGLSNMYSDGFDFSSDPVPRNSGPVETPKEDTKAFDFISAHLSTLRAPRK